MVVGAAHEAEEFGAEHGGPSQASVAVDVAVVRGHENEQALFALWQVGREWLDEEVGHGYLEGTKRLLPPELVECGALIDALVLGNVECLRAEAKFDALEVYVRPL